MDEITCYVVDHGSHSVKSGIAGDDAPQKKIPLAVVDDGTNYLIGDAALGRKNRINVDWPPARESDWDLIEKIWEQIFQDRSTVEFYALLCDGILDPKANREKITEIIFEKFGATALSISCQEALTLYASGRETGLVVSSGHSMTHTVPIYQGFPIKKAVRSLWIGGRDVTDNFQKILQQSGNDYIDFKIVEEMKKRLVFVSSDYDQEFYNQTFPRTYELPDGKVIKVYDERFRCAEILFRPAFHGQDTHSLDQMVYSSVTACDPSIQSEMYKNIVLGGGNTLLDGLKERLVKEMQSLTNSMVKVIAPPEREHSAWIGGSIQGSLSTFEAICASRKEYEECGANIASQKFY